MWPARPDNAAGPATTVFQRCPRGGYLAEHGRLADELSDWQRGQMARGWTPTPWQGKSDNYKDTGVATWCSSVTAKPPECRHDPLATLGRGDRVFNRRMQSSGKPGFPVRSVHGGRVELLHNYKVAGTALKRCMTCEYGTEADTDHVLSVLPVRDPIDRFVSAVGEVLQRFLNNVCPDGPCKSTYQLPRATRNTAWRRVALDPPVRGNLTAAVLPALMAAFVDDASCCHSGYALDHLQPQSAFATYAVRGIDLLLRYDRIKEGLDELARRVAAAALPGSSSGNTGTGSDTDFRRRRNNCSLGRANDAASRPPNIPSAAALRAALEAQPHLMRRLCDVYHQDFACFGLTWPAECSTSKTASRDEQSTRGAAQAIHAAAPNAVDSSHWTLFCSDGFTSSGSDRSTLQTSVASKIGVDCSIHWSRAPSSARWRRQQRYPPRYPPRYPQSVSEPSAAAEEVCDATEPPMATPTVSAMVLTCNRHAFAALAVRQLARQTYPLEKIEVILLDDGTAPIEPAQLQQNAGTNVLVYLEHLASVDNASSDDVTAHSTAQRQPRQQLLLCGAAVLGGAARAALDAREHRRQAQRGGATGARRGDHALGRR